MSRELSTSDFELLRDFIRERTGIRYADSKAYLLSTRVMPRMTELGIETGQQYLQLLTTGPYQDDEQRWLFDAVTINETSFFRTPSQLEALERTILPSLIERCASTRELRIWSAACSTGEEPYTLAILLRRVLGFELPNWKIDILGTDLSPAALAIAEQGLYDEYSFRTTSDSDRARSFRPDGRGYRVNDDIRSMVRFGHHNLMDALGATRFGKRDLILCRNVMIYFDDESRSRCATTFDRVLTPEGYLLIGHSETLDGLDGGRFQRLEMPGAFAYERADAGGARRAA